MQKAECKRQNAKGRMQKAECKRQNAKGRMNTMKASRPYILHFSFFILHSSFTLRVPLCSSSVLSVVS
jgi:hypothetical protein